LIAEAMLPNLGSREGRREAIREFVKPIMDRFQPNLQTFHFFFEPNALLLRLRADDRFVAETMRPYLEETLREMKMSTRSVQVEANYTEERDDGRGWELALKISETGSRSAILSSEAQIGNIMLDTQYNEGKFVPLFLNQFGYSIEEDAVLPLTP
jgi:hypothetical protein